MEERTSIDGAALIALGVIVLIAGPFAKIAAYAAIAYGAWTIWKKEDQIWSILISDPAGKFNILRCSTPLR